MISRYICKRIKFKNAYEFAMQDADKKELLLYMNSWECGKVAIDGRVEIGKGRH